MLKFECTPSELCELLTQGDQALKRLLVLIDKRIARLEAASDKLAMRSGMEWKDDKGDFVDTAKNQNGEG